MVSPSTPLPKGSVDDKVNYLKRCVLGSRPNNDMARVSWNFSRTEATYCTGKGGRMYPSSIDKPGYVQKANSFVSMVGNNGDNDQGTKHGGVLKLRTACRVKDFKETVTGLSSAKQAAIIEMGFGSLLSIGCCKLHREICEMLVDNFDVENCILNIHGRAICIGASDFQHIMGVRNGGRRIEVGGIMEAPFLKDLMWRLASKNKEMTTEGLKAIVIDCDEVDETFRAAFVLYTLATLLCPTMPNRVDPRLIHIVLDPESVAYQNWASFCFDQLVEGVRSYKENMSNYMSGCILFLQLFYLNAICYSSSIVPLLVVPIVGWTRGRADTVIKWIVDNGGFHCNNIVVRNRNYGTRLWTTYDADAGVGSAMCGGSSLVQSDVDAIEADVGMLSTTVRCMKPNVGSLSDLLSEIHNSLGDMKVPSVENVIGEVVKVLTELGYRRKYFEVDKVMEWKNVVDGQYDVVDGREPSQDTKVDTEGFNLAASPLKEEAPSMQAGKSFDAPHNQEDCILDEMVPNQPHNVCPIPSEPDHCREEVKQSKIQRKISRKHRNILTFLFSNAGMAAHNAIEEVARYGEFGVSHEEIQSLLPKTPLTQQVINIAAAYLVDNASTAWFFPSTFGEQARKFMYNATVEVSVASIIAESHLQRFHRQLKRCTEIFIPLNDVDSNHWFLLVVKLKERTGEIWDNEPSNVFPNGRVEQARGAMILLHRVFASEMSRPRDVYYEFPTFELNVPEGNPTVENNFDSGLYTIRHMQYYRQKWFEGFNSDEQRRMLAIEIVANPKNEAIDKVTEYASNAKRRIASGGRNSSRLKAKLDNTGIESEDKHVNGKSTEMQPTGRKCRSHRKRKARA